MHSLVLSVFRFLCKNFSKLAEFTLRKLKFKIYIDFTLLKVDF